MAERSFKERYEEGQCAGFGKIYTEQELAKEIAKGQSTDTPIKRSVRTAFFSKWHSSKLCAII